MNKILKNISLTITLFLSFVLVLSLFTFFTIKQTFSNLVAINANSGEEVSIYVSGKSVIKEEDNYKASVGDEVTITIVNENAIFESVDISGTTYYNPVVTISVPQEGLDINVTTSTPSISDKGKYFANPFEIKSPLDVIALANILSVNDGSSNDYERFNLTKSNDSRSKLQTGYFLVSQNITISDENFVGIGSRSYPFQGAFDFNGNYIYLNINKTTLPENIFSSVDGKLISDIGFFSIIYGNGTNPSLIRNADLRGSIAIKTVSLTEGWYLNNDFTISIGGIAGSLGKNVILDKLSSQVSISAQMEKSGLNVGGIAGFLSANVDAWSNVSYSGLYGNISGITYGEDANIYVGGLAGVIQNSYVLSFTNNANSTTFLSYSYGTESVVSGNAFAGGLAGVVYVGEKSKNRPEIAESKNIAIENIRFEINDKFTIATVIKNEKGSARGIDPDSFSTTSSGAVSGGLVGSLYCYNNENSVEISNVRFESVGEIDLEINSMTLDEYSTGVVFAGGLIGYVYESTGTKVYYKPNEGTTDENNPVTIFKVGTNILAQQNGVGPAYAGGLFGYNAFDLHSIDETSRLYFKLSDESHDFNISAVQSSLSSNKQSNGNIYPVLAGFYSSKLQKGYNLTNFELQIDNGSVIAKREAGSTAIGDIAAGGIAGEYDSNGNSIFSDVVAKFSSSVEIKALGYSLDSSYSDIGNNVYAGGIVGHILNFTSTTNNSYISNVLVDFTQTMVTNDLNLIAVEGIQNAISGRGDYKSEGFVGGIFGMVEDSTIKSGSTNKIGISFRGNPSKTIVRFSSTNNPNTASVGGAIGATRIKSVSHVEMENIYVYDAYVVGKAYFDGVQSDPEYDIYVGGAIGVFGNADYDNRTARMQNIYVYDSLIESIGEVEMKTYAGGVFGGIWWKSGLTVNNANSIGNSVFASSVTSIAYSAGLAGLAQACSISNSNVVDTIVNAKSNNSYAYSGGIIGRTRGAVTLNNNLTSAVLGADGNTIIINPFICHQDNTTLSKSGNYYVVANAGVTNTDINAIAPLSNNLMSTTVNLNVNASTYIYSNLPSNAEIVIGDKSIATLNGNTITGKSTGETYVIVNFTIEDKKYQISFATVIVGNVSSPTEEIELKNEDQEIISEENTTSYATKDDWTYLKIHIGNEKTQQLTISPSNDSISFKNNVYYYDLSKLASSFDDTDAESRLIDIINKENSWSTSYNSSVFNGRVTITNATINEGINSINISPLSVLREDVILGIKIGSKYVIVEVIPNRVKTLSVTDSEDTPCLSGDGTFNNPFVYSLGETLRFDALIEYEHPFRSYMVEVSFSGGSNVNGSGSLEVKNNGTVKIPTYLVANTKYKVTCTINDGTPLVESANSSYDFYILVKSEVSVTYIFEGTVLVFNRTDHVAVSGSPFKFSVISQPGYGLNPNVTINGTLLGKLEHADGNYQVVLNTHTINYSIEQGIYTFILPDDLINDYAQQGITINVAFLKVHTILFINDLADSDEERYFTVAVESGKTIQELYENGFFDEFLVWYDSIDTFGFEKKEFYLTEDADSMSTYGSSFTDLCGENTLSINGSVAFFLRWTYTLISDLPENITIESALSSSLVSDDNIMPINTKKGFAFEIVHPIDWVGTPRFNVYIVNSSGDLIDITNYFTAGTTINSYVIDNQTLSLLSSENTSGCLYVIVYSDSLEFMIGDSDSNIAGDSIYGDSFFTIKYTQNYGSNDSIIANPTFTFSQSLPINTIISLYYQADNQSLWSGSFTLVEETTTISLSNLTSFSYSNKTLDDIRNNSRFSNEVFNLVIILPSNSENFSFGNQEYIDLNCEVNYYEFSKKENKYPNNLDINISAVYTDSLAKFKVYKTIIHTVEEDGEFLHYKTINNYVDGVIDLRNNNSYYYWQIVSESSKITNFECSINPVLITTNAIYYDATINNDFEIGLLNGYVIRLIRTNTSMYPSSGEILFEKSFG